MDCVAMKQRQGVKGIKQIAKTVMASQFDWGMGGDEKLRECDFDGEVLG